MGDAIDAVLNLTVLGKEGLDITDVEGRKSAAHEAARMQDRQMKKQEQIAAEAEARRTAEEEQASNIKARNAARNRQRSLAADASAGGGTILTGPLGLSGSPTTAGKTLLGQ